MIKNEVDLMSAEAEPAYGKPTLFSADLLGLIGAQGLLG